MLNPTKQKASLAPNENFSARPLLPPAKPLLLVGNFNSKELAELIETGYQFLVVGTNELIEQSKSIAKTLSGIIIKQENYSTLQKCLVHIKKRSLQLTIPILLYTTGTVAEKIRKHGVVDEIIHTLSDKQSLNFKLSFLAKVKKTFSAKFKLPDKIVAVKNTFGYWGKRAFDVTAAILLLIILSPVMLIVAILIKLESKGPILYSANRAGRFYKIFPCYKFRTMVVDADKMLKSMAHLNQYSSNGGQANFIKIKSDPRITKIGHFLRNTSLDEIPQLFNVILGHMSLVGNRPLPLYEATSLTDDYNSNRFCAPAGLTGLWQVMKRGDDEMSVEERIDLDIQYAKNASPLVDFWILIKTPFAMFQKADV